jgi:hypothetical protein
MVLKTTAFIKSNSLAKILQRLQKTNLILVGKTDITHFTVHISGLKCFFLFFSCFFLKSFPTASNQQLHVVNLCWPNTPILDLCLFQSA